MFKLAYFSIFILVIFTKCSKPIEELHPNSENYQFDNLSSFIIDYNSTSQEHRSLIKSLESANYLRPIDKDLIIGTIADIEIDPNGNIYLLDQDQIQIFKFNPFIDDTLGRKGKGPGELTFPLAMEYVDGDIYVCDMVSGVLVINSNSLDSLKNDNALFAQSYVDVKKSSSGLFLRKMLYQPNPSGDSTSIDFYDFESGRVTYSFGKAYKSSNRLAVRHYSRGFIEYVPANDLVLSINYHSPKITAYKKGLEIWEKRIPDFIPFQMISKNQDPVSIRYHEKHSDEGQPFDEIKTLLQIKDQFVLMQILRNKKTEELEGVSLLDTYIIDSDNGNTLKTKDMPLIMSVNQNLFVTFETNENFNFKLYRY